MSDARQMGPVVWIAGSRWEELAGTDKCLVNEIAKMRPVLWIDPPESLTLSAALKGLRSFSSHGFTARSQQLALVSPNIWRLKVPMMRGAARPLLRAVKAKLLDRAARSALTELEWVPEVVVVAHAFTTFPQGIGGRRVYFVTDDWLEGSEFMGVSKSELWRVLRANISQSHDVVAVSPYLVERLQQIVATQRTTNDSTPAFAVLPNGCPGIAQATEPGNREPTVCLVGQLNERLDLDVVEAVVASGVRMIVIGPRTDRDPTFGQRLDHLLSAQNVEWLGLLEVEEVHQHLLVAGAGITPYANTRFNQASFPLKTLEYLSAGLAVVSTETPSARWLDTHLIVLRSDPGEFAQAVLDAVETRHDHELERQRREFSAQHSWAARALEFQRLVTATTRTHRAKHSSQTGEEVRS